MNDTDVIEINVCGLEPPEPLERVLDALSNMQSHQKLRVIISREPFPLYRILDNNGYQHETTARPDYLYEVLIWQQS